MPSLPRSFSLPKTALLCGAALFAACATAPLDRLTANRFGTHEGFYFTYWKDAGVVTMDMYPAGGYGVQWDLVNARNAMGEGNFVGGKGWEIGSSSRKIGYNAEVWAPEGNGYLTLYGWTTDPLIEYYVVDSWGDWRPPGKEHQSAGTVETDGGVYDLYRTQRVDKPSIRGTTTFYQYWSVRRTKRETGSDQAITFANHVKAWKEKGWELGSHYYQVLATEGYQSKGRSKIRLWEE